jgi:hypothetical protein
MPLLILKLLGIGKWLKEAFSALFGLIRTYPLQAALVVALCLAGWLWHGKSKAIEQRDAWHLAFDKQKTAYELAQKAAEAKQRAADQDNLSGQLAANRELDKAHAELEALRPAAARQFILDGQLRAKAACGAALGASASSVPDNPATPDSGRADSDLVAVKPEDIDAWSKVEVQNADRGNFIRGLMDQGLAIPEVGF